MFRSAGIIDVQVTPVIHTYPRGNSRRNILCALLENVRDRIVVLTDVEFKEQLSELKRHLDNASTLIIPHLFLQVWGKKPE